MPAPRGDTRGGETKMTNHPNRSKRTAETGTHTLSDMSGYEPEKALDWATAAAVECIKLREINRDLLAALINCRAAIDYVLETFQQNDVLYRKIVATRDAALASIAKAKGE